MSGPCKWILGTWALVLALPVTALAQASLSGLVRDASGAVLPGVTVEASSPVLIEKVRSAVTDGTGRYTIPDLRPGTYRVTFTLPGFRTIVREGVELSGTAVFTVNADMAVGGVQETITVSGETPVVNLQTTTRQAVMDQEVVIGDSQLANALHHGRADPGRPQGRLHRAGRRRLGRPGSGLARSQRRPNLRPAHDGQRRRAQLGDRRRMGRRRGPERDRHRRVRHRRLGRRCAGGDRRRADQLHPAGRRQPLQRHRLRQLRDRGLGEPTTSPAATCSSAGLVGPGNDQGERRLQSGLRRTDQARQAVVLPVGAPALRRQLRGGHVLQPEREQPEPLRLRAIAEPGDPPPGADHLPGARHVAGRARRTRSASPSTRRTSAPARRPSARNPGTSSTRPRPATTGASRCSVSSPSTGTRRSAAGC